MTANHARNSVGSRRFQAARRAPELRRLSKPLSTYGKLGAERAGHVIVEVYADNGHSGGKSRDERAALDAALKDAVRRRFDVLAAWSVDRLGRSLQYLVATLQDLSGAGVDLILHQQALDTATPSGRAMYGMHGVFAEFERAMIVERVKAGLPRARVQGKRLGRHKVPVRTEDAIRQLRAEGVGIKIIAKRAGSGVDTVQRLVGHGRPPRADGTESATPGQRSRDALSIAIVSTSSARSR